MTRQETETYYRAIGRANDLLAVESTETEQLICKKLKDRIASGATSIAVETFRNDFNGMSFSIACSDAEHLDVYQNRQCTMFGETPETVAAYIAKVMPKSVKSPYDRYIEELLPDGTYRVKIFETGETYVLDPADEKRRTQTTEFVLGEFRDGDGHIEYHPIVPAADRDLSQLARYIEYIQDDALKVFAETCINLIPTYVQSVPACLDGQKRPAGITTEGGLLRHMADTVEMMLMLTGRDYASIEYTRHEVDMMIIAAMMHDFLHRGWQEDYEKDPSVKFDHPRMAAQALRCIRGIIPMRDLIFITNCIESHQGQRNLNPDDPMSRPLPIPDTKCKYLVHLANFLATRPSIAIIRDNRVFAYSDQEVITAPRCTSISSDNLSIIRTAMDCEIEPSDAEALAISDDPRAIKLRWDRMLKTGTMLPDDSAYIELARRSTFF